MTDFSRISMNTVRFVAAGFLVVGVLNALGYVLKCRHDHVPISILWCFYLSIPLVIGVAILVKSKALARRLEEYLEE